MYWLLPESYQSPLRMDFIHSFTYTKFFQDMSLVLRYPSSSAKDCVLGKQRDVFSFDTQPRPDKTCHCLPNAKVAQKCTRWDLFQPVSVFLQQYSPWELFQPLSNITVLISYKSGRLATPKRRSLWGVWNSPTLGSMEPWGVADSELDTSAAHWLKIILSESEVR